VANATPAASATGSPDRSGYAVQVAAVNAKSEADSIATRLSGKGYAAYVENPKGSQKMFRVRVGTFKTRSEATTVANKLKKEEKFNPWVTR
jgi:cell division septation protein DedD